jgi:heme exporter protein C
MTVTPATTPRPARAGGLGSMLARALDLRWRVLPPAAGVAMLVMIVGAVLAAPREIIEGEVQRLMYIHVPSAIAAYLAFTVTFVASIVLLWKGDMRFDPIARGAAGVGVLFTGLTLATGAIWGKPIWGVYWTWDARLTSTLLLFLLFGGYLLARQSASANDERAARWAAVFAVIAFLDIPLIHMSVRWWRTLHPQPIVVSPNPALPGEMLAVLLIGFAAVGLLALWLISLSSEAERVAQRTEVLRAAADRAESA